MYVALVILKCSQKGYILVMCKDTLGYFNVNYDVRSWV
jgi:hypothetical protein